MSIEKTAILRSSVAAALGKLASWLSSVWVATVISDTLGESQFATYALVLSFAALGSILDLGSIATFAEFAASSRWNGTQANSPLFRYACRKLFRSITLFFCISLISISILYLVLPDITDYKLVIYSCMALLIASFGQLSALVQRVYANNLKEYKFSLLLALSSVVTALVVVCLAKSLSPTGALLAIVTVSCTTTIAIWLSTGGFGIVISAFSSGRNDQVFNEESNFDSYSYIFVTLGITAMISGALDTVLVARFLNISDVGRHGFGIRIFMGIALAQLSVNQLWPILSRHWESGNRTIRQRLVYKVYGFSLFSGIVAALSTILIVNQIQACYFPTGIRYNLNELFAFGILGVSAGVGGISLALCAREKLLRKLLLANCIYCVLSLPIKYLGSTFGGLGGFLWAAVSARLILYDIPIAMTLVRSISSRIRLN